MVSVVGPFVLWSDHGFLWSYLGYSDHGYCGQIMVTGVGPWLMCSDHSAVKLSGYPY